MTGCQSWLGRSFKEPLFFEIKTFKSKARTCRLVLIIPFVWWKYFPTDDHTAVTYTLPLVRIHDSAFLLAVIVLQGKPKTTKADVLISEEDTAGEVIKIKISEDSNSSDL